MLQQTFIVVEPRTREESIASAAADEYPEQDTVGENFSELEVVPHCQYPQTQLSYPDVLMVCSLLNTRDEPFLESLLSEVRGDTVVARAVLGGVCCNIDLLNEESALGLLGSLHEQRHSSYASDFAIALLDAARFANSFEVARCAAHIVETERDCLTVEQRAVLWDRAGEYPMNGLLAAQSFSVNRQLIATPQNRSGPEMNDYAGAVATLLCAQIPLPSSAKRGLLALTVQFAKSFPQAENVWIEVLAKHAPGDLRRWEVWLREDVSYTDCARAFGVSVFLSPLVTCGLVTLAVKVAALPPGAGLNPIAVAFGALSLVQLSLVTGLQLGSLLNRYDVDAKQKEQVLRRGGVSEWG